MANIRLNLPDTGIRQTNTGKWAAVVLGQFRGEFEDRLTAAQTAGCDKVLR